MTPRMVGRGKKWCSRGGGGGLLGGGGGGVGVWCGGGGKRCLGRVLVGATGWLPWEKKGSLKNNVRNTDRGDSLG